MVKGEDGQMVECEIVSTRDHESVFDKNAPVLPVFLSVICAILNIVPGRYYMHLISKQGQNHLLLSFKLLSFSTFSGLGTWFSALMSLCCSKSNPDGSKMKTFSTTMLTGLLQLILSPFIVGIIWSLRYKLFLNFRFFINSFSILYGPESFQT